MVRIVSLVATLAGVLAGATAAGAQVATIAKIEKQYETLFAGAKYEAALTQARKLVAVTRSRLGERDPQRIAAIEKLSLAYAALGRDQRAVAVAEEAVEFARERNAAVGSDLASVLARLANRLDSGARQDSSRPYINLLRAKLGLLQQQPPKVNALKVAVAATELAVALVEDGEFERATAFHSLALASRERLLGASDLLVAENLHGLAVVAAKQGQHDEAERLFTRVLAIREQKLGPTHGDVADTLEKLADVLAPDRRAEADALFERAQVIRRTDAPSFLRGPAMKPGRRFGPPPVVVPAKAPHGISRAPL